MSLIKQAKPSRNDPAQLVFSRGSLRSLLLELESPPLRSRPEETTTIGVPLPLTPKVTYYPSHPQVQEQRSISSRHGSIDSILEVEEEEDASLAMNHATEEASW